MTRTYAAARPARAARPGYPATDAQVQFVRDLAAEVHKDNAAEFLLAHEESSTFADRAETSRVIDALLAAKRDMRRRAGAAADKAIVWPEESRYAVVYEGVLRFYRVVEGKGRWEGRRFLNRHKSDELGRVGRDEQKVVLAAINADPMGAQMLFARELTRCYICGRMLTDEASRAAGIGPDCAGRR